jgi:hypothetical protein
VALIGDKKNSYSLLMEKPEGKRRLGKTRCRWEGNIKTCLKEIGWEGVNWINLAHDRNKC